MRKRAESLVLAVLLLLFSSAAAGQTTFATITGTVTDATGAVIPGVTVKARHVATGIETSARSNESGIYTLAQLREGDYTLTARGSGF
ncbi:MAG: carboxypeptidase regulatory-like domain-containing protein, partial [Acidobacteria bacterium]|nr:carboxypeptidase regulatory-like domain-containing protein [Acidobacteriota bacterium]